MPRAREWQGSVFKPADKRHLYIKYRLGGAWTKKATPYLPGEEAKAEELLAEVREGLLAREAAMGGDSAPVTVRGWSKRWLEQREDEHGDDARNLRLHILPAIGDRLVGEVEPRHVLEMVKTWTGAARSIRNRYSTAHSMFRDAAVEGLVKANPCMLSRPAHLPPIEDDDAEWRAGAVFKRAELERLIAPHEAVEEDSRVTYALLGLGALRHGELAALRWRHYDPDRGPLGSFLVANSNRRRRTKAGKTRLMPVHPVLAATLAAWRLSGWARLIGRPPTDEDLILPLPLESKTGRRTTGKRAYLQASADTRMRTKDFTWKRSARHLTALGMRHRRVHDLRRTFISLAREDGADKEILRWGTHGRGGDIMDAYTEMAWRSLCGEVAKLRVSARGPRVVPLHGPEGHARGASRPSDARKPRKTATRNHGRAAT